MASPQSNIRTRFLVISDTHDFDFDNPKHQAPNVHLKHPFPKADVLLHCGDLTMGGGLDAYKKVLQMLSTIDVELKLVIAGNHDFSLDHVYGQILDPDHTDDDDDDDEVDEEDTDKYDHEQAMALFKGPLAKEAGVTYLCEGTHTFTLKNGAKFTVYTSPYQPRFWGSFQYDRDQDRFNTASQVAPGHSSIANHPIPDFPNVDIIMTHGPPQGIFDWTISGEGAGCENLLRAASRARPRLYCFGHIHESHGAKMVTWKDNKNLIGKEAILGEENKDSIRDVYPEPIYWPAEFGKQTLMVNAAIMDLQYRPTNPPWLIDLDLSPVTESGAPILS